MQIDERKGGTSASNAQADSLCPGRHLAQKGIPDEDSDDAKFGRIIHAALADSGNKSKMDAMNTEQRDIFDSCREIEKKQMEIYFGNDTSQKRVFREQRYWCAVDNKFMHSGQPDMVMRGGMRALIVEYKTLPGDVPSSPSNMQLRDQSVLASGNLKLNEVAVVVNQPLVTHTPEITVYNAASLERAETEMFERIRRSNDPNSPRNPGEVQCKYCRARNTCDERAKWAKSLMPTTESLPGTAVMLWTPEQKALFLERRSAFKEWIEDCEDNIKKMLAADPNSVPGWELEPGSFRTTIKEVEVLWGRFEKLGGKLPQFMKCINIVKGRLEDEVRVVTITRGKELKTQMDGLLDGVTETKQGAPSLAKKK